jgi:hypothetical protein
VLSLLAGRGIGGGGLVLVALLVGERGGREGPSDPDVGLEVDFVARGALEAHLDDGHPEHDLLAAHARHALHPPVLHVRRHLRVVAHPGARAAEVVFVRRLLPHPHEPGLPHQAALLQRAQRHHAAGEAQRLEHLLGVRVASLRARDHLRALALLAHGASGGRRRRQGEGGHFNLVSQVEWSAAAACVC